MATDPRKRQKKLERHASKRHAKHHQLAREKSAGLAGVLRAAASCPLLHSWVADSLSEKGMGWVGLSRRFLDGDVAFAVFLVDAYCLGVKDAMSGVINRSEYDTRIAGRMRSEFGSQDVTPAAARKVVEGAVEYARKLGFAPHSDYQRAKLLFGDIDRAECTEEFEYGKDGKPLFISGPFDSPQRCQSVLKSLERSCGPGGFNVIMPLDLDTEEIGMIDEDAVGW